MAWPRAPNGLEVVTWYSVFSTPEPSSVALSDSVTGPVYVPPAPGAAGSSVAVVTGATGSGHTSGVTRK